MSPQQCRASRAWLNWTQPELAEKAGVGVATIKDFERGVRTPMANNLKAMRAALEAAGVTLLFDGDKSVGLTVEADREGA